jgi:hypothetical protein
VNAHRYRFFCQRDTFTEQWLSGLPLASQRSSAYQLEKTLPTKTMIVSPVSPSSLTASTYHQA